VLDRSQRDSLLDRLDIPITGKLIVQEAAKYAPVRPVVSRGGNVNTVYQSWKMQREIRTESRNLEFPGGVEHEHDRDVLEFYPQPCRLKFEVIDDQGEIHQIDHIPDFLVITGKRLTLEEWKSEAKLEGLAIKQPWRYQRDADGNWYSPYIENWLGDRGIRYRIRTDASISRRSLENTLFIEDYLHPSAEHCPIDAAARIQETLSQEAVLYLAELYEKAECRPDDVFKLIADGMLISDFDGASLSEPNRFRVFRDHAVRDFEKARHAQPTRVPVPGVLELQVGQRLKYNHAPYTVDLIGQNKVLLSDEQGQLVEITIDTLTALAGSLVQETKNDAEGQPSRENLSDFTEDELRIALARQCGIWIARQVGLMLSNPPTENLNVNLADTLGQVIAKMAGGNIARFASWLELSKSTVWGWVNRGGLPTLHAWLNICRHTGLTLDKLMRSQLDGWVPPIEPPQFSLGLSQSSRKGISSRVLDWEDIDKQLQTILAEDIPITLSETCLRLGIDHKLLYLRANQKTRAISARYREYEIQEKERREQLIKKKLDGVLKQRLADGYDGISARDVQKLFAGTELANNRNLFSLINEVREAANDQ
jgi:hypothetical protein